MASFGSLSVICCRMRPTIRALSSEQYFYINFTVTLFLHCIGLCYRWENVEEGMFRIVDSIALANLWAIVKGNKSMNYEKLSRAMRLFCILF